MKMYKYIIK